MTPAHAENRADEIATRCSTEKRQSRVILKRVHHLPRTPISINVTGNLHSAPHELFGERSLGRSRIGLRTSQKDIVDRNQKLPVVPVVAGVE